jgi:hypothetical protein
MVTLLLVSAVLAVLGAFHPEWSRNAPVHYGPFVFFAGLCGLVSVNFLVDVLFVALTRQCLRWCSDIDNALAICVVISLNCALAALVIGAPLALKGTGPIAGDIAPTLVAFNAADAAAALLVVLVASMALLHRLFWSFVNRPLYAFATQGPVRRRLMVAVGIALLAFAFSDLRQSATKALESIR